ncbi:phage head completion protein [Asticcacaulis sp.]|uniref:phage head completion protein n=1 Tax=Asticcacaulis sp. TaxID=1872648 RepID=UPI003F7BD127
MAVSVPTAGDLRWRVRFDRRATDSANTDGNPQGDWKPLIASRRAKLLPTRGGEITIGDRLAGRSSFDLWVRADSETRLIRPSDRVIDITSDDCTRHRVFDIRFAEVMDERGMWILMQLEATQGEDGRHD